MLNHATREAVLGRAKAESVAILRRCELAFAVAAMSEELAGLFHRTLARHRLTEIGLNVLSVLAARDPASVAAEDVMKHAGLVRGTACHAMAQLELAGLLTFQRDASDHRRSLLHLTAQGRRAFTHATRACVRAVQKLTAPLEDADAIQTATHINHLRT